MRDRSRDDDRDLLRAGHRVVVMGPAGSGKSVVGAALAAELGVPFLDADDLHPSRNLAKMASGTPLDDDDRWPWLDIVARALADLPAGGVIACSALARRYRDRIRVTAPGALFVELTVDRGELERRMRTRAHFMPPALLDSQLHALEHLGADERGFAVANTGVVGGVVADIRADLAAYSARGWIASGMSRIVVTGPPGTGTTLVAAALAARLRVRFIDGAELYPTGSRARKAGDAGEVWLDALVLAFGRERGLVVASGSLSREVRDRIRGRVGGVVFAELVADDDAAASAPKRGRWGRRGVETPPPPIEPLSGDEAGVRVADDAGLESVVDRIASLLSGPGEASRPGQSFL